MRNDPYWLVTRFPGHCAGSKNAKHAAAPTIPAGVRAFYYPRGKYLLCAQCGEVAALEFQAAAADEENYGGGFC